MAATVTNSALSVTGGHAVEDLCQDPFPTTEKIQLTGTTLNGTGFAGQTISGPADVAPFYRIASDTAFLAF